MSVIKNETLKLIANWCNSASVTLGGAGVVVPILSKYYYLGPQPQDDDSIWSLVVICGSLSLIIHLAGQVFIGGLDE